VVYEVGVMDVSRCAYGLCAYDISWYGAMVGIVVECGE